MFLISCHITQISKKKNDRSMERPPQKYKPEIKQATKSTLGFRHMLPSYYFALAIPIINYDY